jgi:hypothetical protein
VLYSSFERWCGKLVLVHEKEIFVENHHRKISVRLERDHGRLGDANLCKCLALNMLKL